jgi:hypothetical protein
MNQGPMATRPLDGLDPVIVLSASEQFADARAIAERDLHDAQRREPKEARLIARMMRRYADVLLADPGGPEGETPEAAQLARATALEARRRHRPFANDARMSAEIGLTAANDDYLRGESFEAERALAHVIEQTAQEPTLQLLHARALRLKAHWQVLRGNLAEGAALVDEALARATGEDGESLVFRLQLLFTRAELLHLVGPKEQVPGAVQAALELLRERLGSVRELVSFGRVRAALIYRATGHDALAAAVEAS